MSGCPYCRKGTRPDGTQCVRCIQGDLYAARLIRSYRLGYEDGLRRWEQILAHIPTWITEGVFERPNMGWEELRAEIEASEREDDEAADAVLTRDE